MDDSVTHELIDTMLEAAGEALRRYDKSWRTDSRITAAFHDCPRHVFGVVRYKDGASLSIEETYTDVSLAYEVTPCGHHTANSMPSTNMKLLSMLNPQPGDCVLEIGSGGGWLLGLAATLVGKEGQVIGLETDQALVESAQGALGELGIKNYEAHVVDAFDFLRQTDVSFDRVVATAALDYIPLEIFSCLKDGGIAVLPLDLGVGLNEVYAFQRIGAELRSFDLWRAYFVAQQASTEASQQKDRPPRIVSLPATHQVEPGPWFGAQTDDRFFLNSFAFRCLLAKSSAAFVDVVENDNQTGTPIGFGLCEGADFAICQRGIWKFGGDKAHLRHAKAIFARWLSMGLPSAGDLTLSVFRDTIPSTLQFKCSVHREIMELDYVWWCNALFKLSSDVENEF